MLPGIANLLCTTSNVGEPGIWRFQIRSGSVVCPDAGTPCDTGLLGACASGHTNCVGSGTECVQDVQPSTDKCDAIDNDCDGQVDEPDAALCADGLFCIAGTCVLPCSEFGCGAGQICDASGLCVDEACVDVVCDQGMRCENGVCVGACDGVVCPTGQVCRAGRCVDPCAGQDCDTCTVCEDGVCVSRCQYSPCASGETCQDDGRCIENACVGVPCDPGFHCEAGSCIDSCLGAVCPDGETCVTGECGGTQPEPPLDGGFGGGWPDDAFAPDPDGGAGLGGSEIGDADLAATDPYGCGCRTPGDGRARASGLFGLALAAMLASRRRGRRTHDR
jgi:MYXO-CTERM domain-containing protein